MAVLLRNEHPKIIIDYLDIKVKVQNIMNNLDCLDQEISILFMKDVDIRQLNKKFRNIDKATDVLSFPQNPDDGLSFPGKKILGDIAISLDKAKKFVYSSENGAETIFVGRVRTVSYTHLTLPTILLV